MPQPPGVRPWRVLERLQPPRQVQSLRWRHGLVARSIGRRAGSAVARPSPGANPTVETSDERNQSMFKKSSSRRRELLLNIAVAMSALGAIYAVSNRIIKHNGALLNLPPRVEAVADWETYGLEGHRMGPSNALVTIVNFSDFTCPFCQTQAPVLRTVRRQFAGQVAVVFRHQPSQRNEVGRQAAIAVECAARAETFEPYHDLLFRHMDSLGTKSWTSIAHEAGVADTTAFRTCMGDPTIRDAVDRDVAAASELGAVVTPTLLINNIKALGYTDLDSLSMFVRAALESRSVSQ
ncbi:MAG: DsbA family protein [Gemmatimonadetes bacterium]|nr:DsbA family protein [Gemmatimonadota bacterium]